MLKFDKFSRRALCLMIMLGASFRASGQSTNGLLDTAEEKETPKVTAVYGVTAEDYLPSSEYDARDYLRPKTRGVISRPAFDLPDGFYFIGGPIFLLILLRVLVIFMNGFEERKKEEENQVASEHFNPE